MIATSLTPAFFAAVGHDPRTLRSWLHDLTELVAIVSFPALAGLAVIASDVVLLVAGPRWFEAALPLRLLALYGIFDVAAQLLSRALVAAGDNRFVARLGMMLVALLVPAFYVGSSAGPAGIALAWLAVAPVPRLGLLWRVRRVIGLEWSTYLRALTPAAVATATSVAATAIVMRAVRGWPIPARVAGEVCAGAAVYVAALWWICRPRMMTLYRRWCETAAA